MSLICSEDFVKLVLLTSWLSLCDNDPCYQVVELFAGAARICKLAKFIGLSACAHDITYDATAGNSGSSFNILGCAGFVLLGFLLGSKSEIYLICSSISFISGTQVFW